VARKAPGLCYGHKKERGFLSISLKNPLGEKVKESARGPLYIF